MNENPLAIRSETLALDSLIRETVRQAESEPKRSAAERVIFLGNRHQSFPTAVIRDPVLEPVDKLIWMTIMLTVSDTGGTTAFPGYDAIGQMANISSRSTVARGIAILRATRWLTLCARVRRPNGRYHGNVYALHDEPLPLTDNLHLDADYMQFIRDSAAHGHARVRLVARAVMDSIDEEIEAGKDVCEAVSPLERRIQSAAVDNGERQLRSFTLTNNAIKRLKRDSIESDRPFTHHAQNSNSASCRNLRAQKSNSVRSSSNNIKTTTTGEPSKFDTTGEGDQPLVYPARLGDNHRELAARYLARLPPDQRQPILDELAGRIQAEARGMKPIYDEISFLNKLCKLNRQGKFQPNLGIGVREQRRERENRRSKTGNDAPQKRPVESEAERNERMERGLKHLEEIGKILDRTFSAAHRKSDDET